MKLIISKGCLWAVDILDLSLSNSIKNIPEKYRLNQLSRDNNSYHITIIWSDYMNESTVSMLKYYYNLEDNFKSDINILGLGKNTKNNNEIYYLVVSSEFFNTIRQKCNLPPSPTFHLTLGFKYEDIHNIDKGLNTIITPISEFNKKHFEQIKDNCYKIDNIPVLEYIYLNLDYLDDKLLILKIKRNIGLLKKMVVEENSSNDIVNEMTENCNILIQQNNYLGYVFIYIFSGYILNNQKKNNIIAENFVKKNIIEKAIQLYSQEKNNKYDPTNKFTQYMINSYNKEQLKVDKIKNKDSERVHIASLWENTILIHKMPRNFSWLIENKIGGISALRNEKDIISIKTLGIKKIYYFLDSPLVLDQNCYKHGVEIEYVYCENTKTPSLEDIDKVLNNIPNIDYPVLFGCLGGYGRTGTALACYLVKFGKDNKYKTDNIDFTCPQMSSNDAYRYLRSVRPKSIENDKQLNFVNEYSNYLYKIQLNNEPECTIEQNSLDIESMNIPKNSKVKNKSIKYKSIKLIILVGLPGAGKSSFCELFSSCGKKVKILNQDILGKRYIENNLLGNLKSNDIVIIDRTNILTKDRKEWIELSLLNSKNILCIYLSTSKHICIDRAKNRENHPTIKKGGGERIISEMDSKIEIPNINEGFSEIITLEDEEDVRNYLKIWNCAKIEIPNNESQNYKNIYKFPRTKHLINIGGASRDDLIVSKEVKNIYFSGCNVQICEKVDGAQLGFSMDSNYQIFTQNRSHYVNSKSHSQFKQLDRWIDKHQNCLLSILDENTVLYGEWLYAKHSIEYTELPDYFLAFDLFDKKSNTFYSRDILLEKLKNTQIIPVRNIYEGPIKTEKQLLDMLKLKSEYTDSIIEGIYLKININDKVEHRSKIVRNDFIAGNEHWSKGIITQNKCIF